MLHVCIQPNTEAKNKIDIQVAAAKKKKATVVRFTDSSFLQEEFEKYLGATDLFGEEFVVILDRIFANTEAREIFWKDIFDTVTSTNSFWLFEEKILADDKDVIKKAGGEITEDKTKSVTAKSEFNIFALGDALGARDKKKLWVLYQKALRVGKAAEEINGTLFWAIKSMLTVKNDGGKNLNPYVQSKSKNFLKNYKEGELDAIAFGLVKNYHESRRGGLPLEEKLEQFILSL